MPYSSFFFESTGSMSEGLVDQQEDLSSSSIGVLWADDANATEVTLSDPPRRTGYD